MRRKINIRLLKIECCCVIMLNVSFIVLILCIFLHPCSNEYQLSLLLLCWFLIINGLHHGRFEMSLNLTRQWTLSSSFPYALELFQNNFANRQSRCDCLQTAGHLRYKLTGITGEIFAIDFKIQLCIFCDKITGTGSSSRYLS